LIIVGASARAAAASALRAGFSPWCADLFADADLAAACPVCRLEPRHYPRGLIAALKDAPPGPWLYTGALENHPDLVARVARPLLGNPAETLRRVRDPLRLKQVLREHGLPCPEVTLEQPDSRRRWLVKPRRGAGGLHIRAWQTAMTRVPPRCYLQEWIDGPSYAAIFLGKQRQAELVGVTRQLVGEAWLHAGPFQYCGSIGPVGLSDAVRSGLSRLGRVLAAAFDLRGLFGADFIVHDEQPWPVEVNPRYTASVEILERATGRALVAEHAAVFGVAAAPKPPMAQSRVHGKAVLFATRDMIWPRHGPWDAALVVGLGGLSAPFADIPHAGASILRGQPICTLLAAAESEEGCVAALRRRALTIVTAS
jgi:predicted ATP-grasp superfamily ATP-dependent carboligase